LQGAFLRAKSASQRSLLGHFGDLTHNHTRKASVCPILPPQLPQTPATTRSIALALANSFVCCIRSRTRHHVLLFYANQVCTSLSCSVPYAAVSLRHASGIPPPMMR